MTKKLARLAASNSECHDAFLAMRAHTDCSCFSAKVKSISQIPTICHSDFSNFAYERSYHDECTLKCDHFFVIDNSFNPNCDANANDWLFSHFFLASDYS